MTILSALEYYNKSEQANDLLDNGKITDAQHIKLLADIRAAYERGL